MLKKNIVLILIGGLLFLAGALGFVTNYLKDASVCVTGIGIFGLVLIWIGIQNERYTKSRTDVHALISKLTHKDVAKRYDAAQALGVLKDARATEPLIIALKDENQRVQQAAAEALSLIEGLNLEQTQILNEWFEHFAGSLITAFLSRPYVNYCATRLIPLEVSDCTLMENGDVLINPNRSRGIFAMVLGLPLALVSLWMLNLLISDFRGNFNTHFIVMPVLFALGGILLYLGIRTLTAPEISIEVASRSIHVRARGSQSAQTRPFDAITGPVNVTTLGPILFSLVHVSLRFDDSKSLSLFMTGDKTKAEGVIWWLEAAFMTNDVGYTVDEESLNDDVKKMLVLIKKLDTPNFPIWFERFAGSLMTNDVGYAVDEESLNDDVKKVLMLIKKLDTPNFPASFSQGDQGFNFRAKAVYEKALDFLVAIGLPAVKPLTVALHHPNPNVRLGAIQALGRIGGSTAIESLKAAIQETNSTERAYAVGALGAIQALGRIGGSTAIESLKAAIQETNSTERAYAVRALGKAGRSDALGEIISYLHDPSVGVRESAVYALEEIGDPRALPELELLANSDTALVDRFGPSVGELANKAIKKIRKRTSK